MKTSVINVRDMLSVLSVSGVEERIGKVPGVESVTVNYAAGSPTVRYDETRLHVGDIKSAVRQDAYESGAPVAASAGDGHEANAAIVQLSRATYRKMIQNLVWATGYNVVAIPLAAGALYAWGVLLTPALGAVLMSASTVIVAVNARLLKLKTSSRGYERKPDGSGDAKQRVVEAH